MNNLVNGIDDNERVTSLLDKELRIFINFLDIEQRGTIRKSEFLRQFQKMQSIYQKYFPLYKQSLQQQEQTKGT